MRTAVAANLDISAMLNAADTPEQQEFDRIAADAGPEGRARMAGLALRRRARMRVLVGDPYYSLDEVAEIIGDLAEVEQAAPPWEGEDVVGLLVGPDTPVGVAEIDRLPALRIVATCSVGYDHVDTAAAADRGVWVCNVPDYCVEEMADSSLALVLALMRGVVALDRSVREGDWDHAVAGPLRTNRGTRLGVIGFGRIGRALWRRGLSPSASRSARSTRTSRTRRSPATASIR